MGKESAILTFHVGNSKPLANRADACQMERIAKQSEILKQTNSAPLYLGWGQRKHRVRRNHRSLAVRFYVS